MFEGNPNAGYVFGPNAVGNGPDAPGGPGGSGLGGGGAGGFRLDPGSLGQYGLGYGQGNPASWGLPAGSQTSPGTPSAPNYWTQQFSNPKSLETPQLDTSYADQARLMQQQAIQALQAQANGTLDTYSQHALQANNRQAQQSQYALASSQHGTGAGAQLRQAQQGAGQVAGQLPGQQSILRAQEMQAAQALQAQLMGQTMGQDASQAGLAAQNQLQGWNLQDQNAQWYANQGIQQMLGLQGMTQQSQAGVLGLAQQDWQTNNAILGQFAGAVGGLAGTAGQFGRSQASGGGGGSNLGGLSANPYTFGGVGASTPGMGTFYGQSSPSDWASWNPSPSWSGNTN